MAKSAKYNGKTYEVKPTGRTIHKPAKSYYDFNGYYTEKKSESRKQLGMYDEHGNLYATVSENGEIFNGPGKSIGSTKIKETE